MIEIKSFFGSWIPVDRERAVAYANSLYRSIKTTSDSDKKLEIINKNHIRGIKITAKDIMRGTGESKERI